MEFERWKQIDRLFGTAIELTPQSRMAFLDQQCAGDEELRKEVEALLTADQEASGFIQMPVLDPDAPYLRPGQLDSADPSKHFSLLNSKPHTKTGLHERQIVAGRYELITRLGAGGMGEVWRAHDLKLRIDVALKTLRLHLTPEPELLEGLRREVLSAREVISSNVCRIFDLVVDDNRELISMEYIDGTTLIELLKRKGPLDLSEARDIAAQFLSGLEAIHHAGLVHCDLKPENIMITRTGRVVVMDFGIARGLQQTHESVSGTRPYMPPERVFGLEFDARSDLFSAGVILSEMIHPVAIGGTETREAIWSVAHQDPQQLPDTPWKAVLIRALEPDPKSRFASAQALSRALEKATVRVETLEERGPYPGLMSFSASNAEYFFGRELEVESLIKKLRQLHLTAIVGPSGAGKTSFLRAGLIPALPAGWNCIFCAPGDSPLFNLGQALIHQLSIDTDVRQQISSLEDPATILGMMSEWRKTHAETLLIVDRFEELFTLNEPAVRSDFAQLLATASVDANVRILLCMRDDFLLRCYEHPQLSPIFFELTPLGPLIGPALRRAFLQPALKCGYRFEDEEFVNEVLADVEKERGALPLMAFAAAQLWDERDRAAGVLTRKSYENMGSVAGALAHYAEETMDRIGVERQSIVREIFRNLITANNTRMARDIEELLSIFAERGTTAKEVLRALIDARLLTAFEAQQADGKTTVRRVEIVHESLLSHWPRLIRWQTQDAETMQMRDHLRQSSHLWEQRSRPADLLWTGTSYKEFEIWKDRYHGGLTATEQTFAHAMVQNAGKQKRRRRIAVTAIFVVLLAILVAISSFWRQATSARDKAVLEARRAEAGTVLSAGRAIPDANPTVKLAYALASLELSDSPQARRFALQALSEGPIAYALEMSGPVSTVQWSPDNRWVAAGGQDGRMEVVSQDSSAPMTIDEPFKAGHFIPWNSQFSPDGQFLIWTSRKDLGTVKVWSFSDKKVFRTFHMEGLTMCLVRGGKAFLITDTSGRFGTPFQWDQAVVRTWKFDSAEPEVVGRLNLGGNLWKHIDIDSHARWIGYKKGPAVYVRSMDAPGFGSEKLVGTHTAEVNVVTFNPEGEEIASSDANGEIRLWSVTATENPLRVIPGTGERINLWFSSKGTFLMAARQGKLFAWELKAPRDAEPMVFQHLQGDVRYTSMDQEDKWLCIAGGSSLMFCPLSHDHPYRLKGKGYPTNIRFTPDRKFLMSGFEKDGIRVWNLPGEKQNDIRTLWSSRKWNVESIDVDPFGKYMLAAILGDGIHLFSLPDGKDVSLRSKVAEKFQLLVAYSPDGKSAAAASNAGIEIWDLQSGNSRILEDSKEKRIVVLKYSPAGQLFAGDVTGNLYQWNLKPDSSKVLGRGKGLVSGIAVSQDARYVAVSTWSDATFLELQRGTSELLIYDLQEKKSSPITSHSNRVFSIAFDPSGTKLITGDLDGIVRIGPMTGETPHLLLGHQAAVKDVTVHPGGQWIASVDFGSVVRLWRMPEGTPLQSLPYKDFLNHFRNLTNVVLVKDKNSPTGYSIEYSPLQEWGALRKSQLHQK